MGLSGIFFTTWWVTTSNKCRILVGKKQPFISISAGDKEWDSVGNWLIVIDGVSFSLCNNDGWLTTDALKGRTLREPTFGWFFMAYWTNQGNSVNADRWVPVKPLWILGWNFVQFLCTPIPNFKVLSLSKVARLNSVTSVLNYFRVKWLQSHSTQTWLIFS